MEKKVNAVYETSKYDMFNLIPDGGQRALREKNVKSIMKSIAERGYVGAPIVVNEKLEVIDGQHRLEACRRLGIPIPYMVCPGITGKDCQILNKNAKNWDISDYIHFYSTVEHMPDYKWLEEMRKTYLNDGLPAQLITMVCSRHNTTGGSTFVQDGKFRCPSTRERANAERELDYLTRYTGLAHKVKGKVMYLWTALVFAYRTPEIDNEKLYAVLESNRNTIEAQGNTLLYLRKMSDLYNKNRKKDDRVYLDHKWEETRGAA